MSSFRSRRNLAVRRARSRPSKAIDGQMLELTKKIADSQITQNQGRPPAVPDVPRLLLKRDKVFTFARSLTLASLVPSTTVDLFGAYSFHLDQCANYTEFTALFDQYRIMQVQIDFIWDLGQNSGCSPLYTILDYDDASAPVNLGEYLQYDTLMITSGGSRDHSRVVHPQAAAAMYSGTFTSFGNAPRMMWQNCASPGIQYYGVKYAIPASAGNPTTAAYQVVAKYVLQFRNTR